MTDYYLRDDGSNSNSGLGATAALAWRTLAYAGTQLDPGDRLYIRSAGGTYDITGEHDITFIGSSGSWITVTNYPGETPVFDGTGGTFGATDAILSIGHDSQYLDMGGFTVQNNPGGRGMEIESSISPKANNIILRDIVIHDVQERGLGGGGNTITIINVEVYNFAMSNLNEAFGGVGGWATGIASFSYSDDSLPTNWTVTACYVHHGWGEGVNILRVTGFTLESTTVQTVYSVTVYPDKAQNVTIKNNKLGFDDVAYRKNGRNAHGVTLSGEGTPMHGTSYEVDNILIYNNEVKGMDNAFSWFQDTNHAANSYRNVEIYHNSVYSCNKAMNFASVAALASTPTGCIAKNNIFDGVMTTHASASGWTFTHNCWIDGIPALDTHTSSIHANPLYLSPTTSASSTLHLDPASPCIGAGTYLASVPTDIGSNTRPDPPTIGAYEEAAEEIPATDNQAYWGSFMTGTGALASTFDVTDPGFQPTFVIFMASGRTESVASIGSQSAKRMIGFATATSEACMTTFSLDAGAGATDTSERHTLDACVSVLVNATTRDGELSLNSMLSNGFRMEAVTTQFTTSYRIHYLAVKCTAATVGGAQMPVGTGSASVTGLAHAVTTLFVVATRTSTDPPSTNVDSGISIGAAVSAAKQFVWSGGSNDAAATSVTKSYCRMGEIVALYNTGIATIDTIAAVTSLNSDGWTWNISQTDATAHEYIYLAINAENVDIGSFMTQTDVVDSDITEATAMSPVGGLLISANRAASTTDTPTDDDQWMMGGFSAPPVQQGSVATRDDNGVVGSSDTHAAVYFDTIYTNIDGAGALAGQFQLKSVETDQIVLTVGTTDAADSLVPYWIIGNVVETPPGSDPAVPIENAVYRIRRRIRK